MRVAWSEKGMLAVGMVDRIGCGGCWMVLCRRCDRMDLLGMSFVEPYVKMYFERVSWSCENDRKVLFGSLLEGDAQGPARMLRVSFQL